MFAVVPEDGRETPDNSLRDVVALSTLPAIWTGAEPLRIAESLAASLFTMLDAEFVYVSLVLGGSTSPLAIAQTGRYETDQGLAEQIGPAVLDWSRGHDPSDLLSLEMPGRARGVRAATRAIGLNGEFGAVAAAFGAEQHPRPIDLLLLNVAATQATVAVQNANLLHSLRKEIGQREQAEQALRESEQRLAADLEALRRIQQVRTRLIGSDDLQARLSEILAAAAHLVGTDKGNIQLYDPESGILHIAVHQGFGERFLKRFLEKGSPAVCDTAARKAERMIWEDVASEPALQGTEDLEVILADGIRAIQCTPLLGLDGRLLGLLNNHFGAPHRPGERDLRYLDLLARMAADFIERWHSERAIRESEARFRALTTASSDVIYRMNSDWTEMRFLSGREFIADTNEPGQSWIGNYIYPEDRPEVSKAVQEAIRSKSMFELEHRVIRVDGTPGWTYSRAVPICDANGAIVEWFGTASDITQRRQAEEALAESMERLRIAKESASLGIYDYDPVTGRIKWDERLRQIWGVGPDEPITYDTFLSGLHPDDVAHTDAAVARSLEPSGDGLYQAEYRVISRADGRERWILAIGRAFFSDGQAVRLIGTVQDMTERKQAEEALAESERRFRFMAESMPQKITTAKADGSVDYMNAKWIEFTGQSWDQLREGGWEGINHPDDREENTRLWQHSVQTGEPYSFTHRIRRADGEYRWHLSRAHAMRDRDGTIRMWIGSSTEIHEQKRIEEKLRRANHDLEQFAYSASHDLQEPLRAVKIYSELLSAELGDKLDGDAADYLGFLRSGATRMEMLVRDLLTYTRASVMEGEAEPTDAGECLRSALANLGAAISESQAKISTTGLPTVPVHGAHLRQLFQNLVGNAIKYRRPGSIPEVHIAAERQNGTWRFSVQDNGIGIEPQYQERIFGLFKRLHTDYPGTGIGLALCLRILEHYHGRIWVESEPGKGSIFYFVLPA